VAQRPWFGRSDSRPPSGLIPTIPTRRPAQPPVRERRRRRTRARDTSGPRLEALARRADPAHLNEAFDSLKRISVSSVGVRTTLTVEGTASYRMFAGSGVDRGFGTQIPRSVRSATRSSRQRIKAVRSRPASRPAKPSTGRCGTRRCVSTTSLFLGSPNGTGSDRLLGRSASPQVTRGKRLSVWPTAAPLAAELDYALVGTGWHTSSGVPLETLDVNVLPVGSLGVANQLPLELIAQSSTGPTTIWRGHQDLGGAITALGADIIIQRGIGFPYQLADVLTDRPPTVFFLDGTTVHGSNEFDSRARSQSTPPGMLNALGWIRWT